MVLPVCKQLLLDWNTLQHINRALHMGCSPHIGWDVLCLKAGQPEGQTFPLLHDRIYKIYRIQFIPKLLFILSKKPAVPFQSRPSCNKFILISSRLI